MTSVSARDRTNARPVERAAGGGRPRCRSMSMSASGLHSSRSGPPGSRVACPKAPRAPVDGTTPIWRLSHARRLHIHFFSGWSPDPHKPHLRAGLWSPPTHHLGSSRDVGPWLRRRSRLLRRPSPSPHPWSRVCSAHRFVNTGRWQITEGPWVSTQQVVDGFGWGYGLVARSASRWS